MSQPLEDRIEALRKALHLTHEKVADRSGGILRREDLVKLKSGVSKGTSYRIRSGLAIGFNLPFVGALVIFDPSPRDLCAVFENPDMLFVARVDAIDSVLILLELNPATGNETEQCKPDDQFERNQHADLSS